MLKHAYPSPQVPARVVIIGAGGFIGGAIADRLAQDNISVLRLTRHEINLLSPDAAAKLAAILKPDDVFIAASAMAPCKTPEMLRDNMIMAAAMTQALQQSPVAHVMNISSDAVYADSAEPLTENSITAPDNLHGVMHLAREIIFQAVVKSPLTILRPTLVYGARDPHNGYGPNKFRRAANKGESITLFGEGEERRDHVLVDDIAELAARMVIHRSSGVLNIATGEVTSFRIIADKVVELSGNPVKITGSPRSGPMPHNGYRAFAADGTRAAFPNFKYTPLAQGLAQAQKEEFGNGASQPARLAS